MFLLEAKAVISSMQKRRRTIMNGRCPCLSSAPLPRYACRIEAPGTLLQDKSLARLPQVNTPHLMHFKKIYIF
ncbi:hypothetical protein Hdeb2414_s0019g00548131 [Helianthus debilis subsp. tardiflorus]